MSDDAPRTRFELRFRKMPCSLDPHLQEDMLASDADPDWVPSRSLGCRGKEDGRRYVDVLARLEPDEHGELPSVPSEIKEVSVIGDVVTGCVAVEDIETARAGVKSLKAATDLFLNLHYSVAASGCRSGELQEALPGFPGLDGSGVLVGVVDVGCDFCHRSLRLPSGDTRILYLWDQSDHGDDRQAPQPYGYGRELDAVAINKALREPDPYKSLGYTPGVGAHGTHVMDIAAGNGREPDLPDGEPAPGAVSSSAPGIAPNALLVFVHLKTEDDLFLGNSRHLLEAVDYIFQKADELKLPAVVNLSLSTSGGPHDGSTLVERGFENLLKKPGRAIVISAGNAYGKASHVAGTVIPGKPTTLTWMTDPRDERNEMEVWYGRGHSLEATLVAPDGARLGPVTLGETADLCYDGKRVGRVSHREDDPNNHDNQIDVRVPQPKVAADLPIATPERWTLELSSRKGEVPFHAWIEQNDRGTSRFEGATTRSCTLGSICCGASPLTVGAFDTSERAALGLPWAGTAEGGTRTGGNKPDVSAPGAGIVAARARGGTTLMSGTSMAAAHVTGLVALLFQLAERAGLGPLDVQRTRQLVMGPPDQWDPRLGYRRIQGIEAVKALLQPRPSSVVTYEKPKKQTKAAMQPAAVSKGGNGRKPNGHPEPLEGRLITETGTYEVSFVPVS